MKHSSILTALVCLGLCLGVGQIGLVAQETPAFVASDALCPAVSPLFLAGNCTAQADCGPHPSVSCEATSSSDECSFVDRDCSRNVRGYVRCGSSYTYCPFCPSCTEGDTRWIASGCCCEFLPGSPARARSIEQECSDGEWVNTGRSACANTCPNAELCNL